MKNIFVAMSNNIPICSSNKLLKLFGMIDEFFGSGNVKSRFISSKTRHIDDYQGDILYTNSTTGDSVAVLVYLIEYE